MSPELTTSNTPSISANNLDQYEIETINGIIPSTGTSPYSYTWHISINSGAYSGATQCTANSGSGQIAGNLITCTIPRNTLSGGNFYNFAFEVTDSATAQESAFSASYNTITVVSPAVANSPAVSATSLDADQTEIVTGVMPSTGTAPYTYNWLITDNNGLILHRQPSATSTAERAKPTALQCSATSSEEICLRLTLIHSSSRSPTATRYPTRQTHSQPRMSSWRRHSQTPTLHRFRLRPLIQTKQRP